jgi:hypothetical protein
MAMPRKLLARHIGQLGRFNARNLPLSKEMAKHADFGVMLRCWPARPHPPSLGRCPAAAIVLVLSFV